MRAIQITEFGGPEVLSVTELPEPEPGDGEVLIHVSRAGINFADTHNRENTYLAPARLPLVPGAEVAGTRVDTGARVVALTGQGGYAEYVAAPEGQVFPIPDGIDDATALAMIVQGLTAWHLYATSARLRAGESVVVHAGAGGVGTLAIQLGRRFEAGRIIATASSEEKRALCLEIGADVAIDSAADGMRARLREANAGRPVDAVFEMAGGKVFAESLKAIGPFGRVVAYGSASGETPSVDVGRLMASSGAVVGFWLVHCLGSRAMSADVLQELFAMVGRGELRAVAGRTYALAEAPQAHRDLAARGTIGKQLLDPAA